MIIKKIGLIVLMIICLVGCQKNNNEVTNMGEQVASDYITMTCTGYNNGENNKDGMTTQIWYYDPISNTTENVFSFDTTAQYSLGYYDRKNDVAYYVKRVYEGENYGDQIFITDLKTKVETQLTDEFFAVNHIIPVEDKIFIVACKKNERADKLGYIDKTTHKITFWEDTKDYCVRGIAVDKVKKNIFISAYSMAERDENIRKQTNDDFEMPRHTIYQTDFGLKQSKELFDEKWDIRTIMTNKDRIVALCEKEYNNPDDASIVFEYNTKTGESSFDTWTGPSLSANNPDYSADGKKIYGVAIINGERGLAVYDVETKDMELCVNTVEGNFINNIFVVKDEIEGN